VVADLEHSGGIGGAVDVCVALALEQAFQQRNVGRLIVDDQDSQSRESFVVPTRTGRVRLVRSAQQFLSSCIGHVVTSGVDFSASAASPDRD
jgi:hypothetical protein